MIVVAALLVAVLIGGVGLLIFLRRENARQALLVERMRTTAAYGLLQPLLQKSASLHVESVTIRPEGLKVTLYPPPGKTLQCDLASYDMDPLEEAPLEALVQLVTAEIPNLGNSKRYFLRRYRERVGETRIHWYQYMIQSAYKDEVLRAAYDRPGGV